MHGKIEKKVFPFPDNFMWIGIVKLCLLTIGCFSSAANLLTSITETLHVNNGGFLQLNFLGSDQWIW